MKYHHSVLLILTVAKSYEDMRTFPINSGVVFIYPWRTCAARATVVNPLHACARGVITAVVLCVCVCLCVCMCVCVWGGGGGGIVLKKGSMRIQEAFVDVHAFSCPVSTYCKSFDYYTMWAASH